MKIKSLWISEYKNVQDISLEFKTELTSLLVGQNGLGKSNLLEAIALIFKDLDIVEDLDDFYDWPSQKDHFEYRINYSTKGRDITIICLVGDFRIYEFTEEDKANYHKFIDFSDFKKSKQEYLPDYIIGYYSGVNHRIKHYFSEHYTSRDKNIRGKAKAKYSLGKMFFTEQNLGELLFFTLWVYKSSPSYSQKISKLFEEYLKIDLSSRILIGFNNPEYFAKNKKYLNLSAENIIENLITKNKVEYPFWGLDGKLNDFFQALWDNNLSNQEPIAFDDPDFDIDKNKISFLSFNDLDFETLFENLTDRGITSPLELFDVLLEAHNLNIIYQIHSELVKEGGVIRHNYLELSEGEQQLLTVIGLILITSEFETLYLLDEPDTHLNPNWQRDYIQLLNDFNLKDTTSHIYVATHSPLLVQCVQDDDDHEFDIILYCRDNEGGIEIENRPDIIKNWRIDQVFASKYFGISNTRPANMDEFMTKRSELLSKDNLTLEDYSFLKSIEENDLLPSGETLNDFKAMHLIHKAVKRLPKEND